MATTEGVMMIIDGGGTSTDVAIVHENSIAYRTSLPSFKPSRENNQANDLAKSVGTWLASHSNAVVLPKFVLIGMAGVWSDIEKQSYLTDVSDAWMNYISADVPRFSVLSDVELTQFAAHGTSHGIVLIAGTGSICVARMPNGHLLRSGGWGNRIDDAGSGFWIGREALRAVAHMLDGRGLATQLIRPVAAYLRADEEDHEAVAAALRATSIDRCARLAPSVLTYARENDAVAFRIRESAAEELAALITPLAERYARTVDAVGGTQCIALSGSLFADREFRESVSIRIAQENPDAVMRRVEDVLQDVAKGLRQKAND